MSRKLVFHIGDHKAGSSTIQSAFALDRVKIPGQRVIYPGQMNHNYLASHFSAYVENKKCLGGQPGRPGLEAIQKKMAAVPSYVAVFSAEEFEFFEPEKFHAVLRDFMLPAVDDHVIVSYKRPHAARIVSSFAERIKIGNCPYTLSQFCSMAARKETYDYDTRIKAWQKSFGDKFIVRPMVREVLVKSSVLDDLLVYAFGDDVAHIVGEEPVSNESLLSDDLAILQHLQARFTEMPRAVCHHLGWLVADALRGCKRDRAGDKMQLDKQNAVKIRDSYLKDAKRLDAGVFQAFPVMQRELERAVDEAPETAQSILIQDYFAADYIRSVDRFADAVIAAVNATPKPGVWRDFLYKARVARLREVPEDTGTTQPDNPVIPLMRSFPIP